MSLQARQQLVNRLIFQNDSQKQDLLDPNKTQTELIALLLNVSRYYPLEITAVRSDHHDDAALGEHCHANGFCVDLWPIVPGGKAGEYMDAADPHMSSFLRLVSGDPFLHQVGLAGSADTANNRAAAGPTCFSDSGADHIHISAQ